MAAACRYALTGVGAAIAPGNQKLNGNNADLLHAPMANNTTATVTGATDGGSARMALMWKLPLSCPRTTMPISIVKPPSVVASQEIIAAAQVAARPGLCPSSRYDRTLAGYRTRYNNR